MSDKLLLLVFLFSFSACSYFSDRSVFSSCFSSEEASSLAKLVAFTDSLVLEAYPSTEVAGSYRLFFQDVEDSLAAASILVELYSAEDICTVFSTLPDSLSAKIFSPVRFFSSETREELDMDTCGLVINVHKNYEVFLKQMEMKYPDLASYVEQILAIGDTTGLGFLYLLHSDVRLDEDVRLMVAIHYLALCSPFYAYPSECHPCL